MRHLGQLQTEAFDTESLSKAIKSDQTKNQNTLADLHAKARKHAVFQDILKTRPGGVADIRFLCGMTII